MAKYTTDDKKKYVESAKLESIIIDGLNSGKFGHDAVEILSEIYALESADVEEVVWCVECKHRIDDEDFASGHYCVKRPSNGGYFCDDDDFCSYGERRKEAGTSF